MLVIWRLFFFSDDAFIKYAELESKLLNNKGFIGKSEKTNEHLIFTNKQCEFVAYHLSTI